MKLRLVAVAVVLAALLLPNASWAVFQFCTQCAILGPTAQCTCPNTGPHWIFTTCNKYPSGCELPFRASVSSETGKAAFLASLAGQPAAATVAASPSPAK